MPQLDGLRAYAVGAVMIHHLLDPALVPFVADRLSLGLIGVRMFFVLSGFLITGLLIRAADADGPTPISPFRILRQFYVRRALRIFPLYYLVLLMALVFGNADAREQLPWLATYTYNFWIAALGWFPDYFAHFWSLCVEEQFYLVWPWIILFAPRRRLPAIAAGMIAIAIVYRLIAWQLEFEALAFLVVTPSSLDALGMGAMIAIANRGGPATARLERRLRFTALPIGVTGTLVVGHSAIVRAAFEETCLALVFVWLVAGASHGFPGIGRLILETRPVLYLGKISYGLYVYHLLVPYVFGPVVEGFGFGLAPRGVGEFLVFSLVTVAVASLSWHLFEFPINRMKRKFSFAR